jgi:acetoin utilization deacetylase AcuC-like enzyme
MQVFYSPAYTSSAHDFDTTRKATWLASSIERRPISGVELVAPDPLTVADLLRVHDRRYVEAVRTGSPRDLAEMQGFDWDSGLWEMVLTSNGGVMAAARAALSDGVAGSLSSGLHHARAYRGVGYCTFNGLAIAARALLDEGAVASVLILDFDAHCGGGTASLIEDEQRITQMDVSVSPFDGYENTGNSHLEEVISAAGYLPSVRWALEQCRQPFDLVLYNAGMDPYEGCDVGGLDGIGAEMLAQRERLVFQWCRSRGLPVAFVLAGGYIGHSLDRTALVNLHRLTINAAVQSNWERHVVLSS